MKSLFDQTRLAGITLKNRFVRSATRDGLADDRGHVTKGLLERYKTLAWGGVALIITGHAYVTDREQSRQPGQMGIYDDTFIDDYKQLTEVVHRHDSRIVLQMSCIGAQTFSSSEGKLIWGPSPVEDLATGITPQEMSFDEIRFLQHAFGAAALRAKTAGFDAVQIHAAHGYVLNKFLSPYYNRRKDGYGGDFRRRARMVLETLEAIRIQVGPEYPVMIKVNCEDFMANGMSLDESLQLCKWLDSAGIDAIEVSGGNLSSLHNKGPIRTGIKSGNDSYFSLNAAEIAKSVRVPVILVGGNRDFEKITRILNSSQIGYFSLCRPLLAEPNLINLWSKGQMDSPKCISCNKCLGLEKTVCWMAHE